MPNKKSQSRGKSGNGHSRRRDRANDLDLKKLQSEFEEVHGIIDKQETRNAKDRQAINKIYERAAAALELSVDAVKASFRKERAAMKEELRIKKSGDTHDRDSYLRIAQAYGDTSPMGAWANNMASQIVAEVEGDEGGDEGELDAATAAAQTGKVHQLRAPA